MTDAIDEAREALIGWFVRCCEEQVCDHHTYRDCEAEMRAAADRYALAVFDEGYAVHRLAVEGNWTDCNKRFDALRARIQALTEGRKEKDYVALD